MSLSCAMFRASRVPAGCCGSAQRKFSATSLGGWARRFSPTTSRFSSTEMDIDTKIQHGFAHPKHVVQVDDVHAKVKMSTSFDEVPVIDFAAFYSGDADAKAEVSRRLSCVWLLF